MDPWSRGREVARGVLRPYPKPEKRPIFLPTERDRDFLSPVFYTTAPKCVCIRRLAGARHLPPVVLRALRPEGGSKPLTSAPRSDFMAQSLVLWIDVCPGLGISPLQTNIRLSFSQADLGPRSAQELFFSGFLKSLKLFFRGFVLTASGTEIFWRVSFEISTFYGNIAFPLSPV